MSKKMDPNRKALRKFFSEHPGTARAAYEEVAARPYSGPPAKVTLDAQRKTPIDRMLDGVEFAPVEHEVTPQGLYATHEGTLMIGDFAFKVYQLNDGQRVLDADDVARFFNA